MPRGAAHGCPRRQAPCPAKHAPPDALPLLEGRIVPGKPPNPAPTHSLCFCAAPTPSCQLRQHGRLPGGAVAGAAAQGARRRHHGARLPGGAACSGTVLLRMAVLAQGPAGGGAAASLLEQRRVFPAPVLSTALCGIAGAFPTVRPRPSPACAARSCAGQLLPGAHGRDRGAAGAPFTHVFWRPWLNARAGRRARRACGRHGRGGGVSGGGGSGGRRHPIGRGAPHRTHAVDLASSTPDPFSFELAPVPIDLAVRTRRCCCACNPCLRHRRHLCRHQAVSHASLPIHL